MSGPAVLAGLCDGPERLPIIIFFLVRQVRPVYSRRSLSKTATNTWFMLHLVLAALTRREGTRKDFGGSLSGRA